MRTTTYVVKRVLEAMVTLAVASLLIFASVYAAPGSVVSTLVGGPENVTTESIQAIRAEYNLDQPFLVQYGLWLQGAVQGDFGRSYIYGSEVTTVLASRLEVTLALFVYAYLLILIVGIGLGVASAVRRGWTDSSVMAGTTLAAGTPPFVAAIALIAIFSVQLQWFPVAGAGEGLVDRLYHLTLPAVALAFGGVAVMTRVTRQAMLEASRSEHADVARIRGIPERLVVHRHTFRNALGPIVTMSGLLLASLLAGAVLIETVFGLSGLGSLLVTSINANDFPVVQAILLYMVAVFILATTLTDLVYPLIDPRVSREVSAQ